jgi:molybdenum cofactor biosynthesis enzyme MoaA
LQNVCASIPNYTLAYPIMSVTAVRISKRQQVTMSETRITVGGNKKYVYSFCRKTFRYRHSGDGTLNGCVMLKWRGTEKVCGNIVKVVSEF